MTTKLHPKLAVLIVISGLVLAFGVYSVAQRSLDQALNAHAVHSAQGWAEFLATNIPDLESIAAGNPPSDSSVAFVNQTVFGVGGAGEVFRFKIFDNIGRLRLVSDETHLVSELNEGDEGVHAERAIEVIATGRQVTQLKTGTMPDRPANYAEVYYPIFVDGQLQTVIEVYVDTTHQVALFYDSMTTTGLLTAGIIAFAFGIPSIAFLRRSRQKRIAEADLKYLAHHDWLTKTLNRGAIETRVDKLLSEGAAVAVLYIDADRFKQVNDTLGHTVGDSLICAIASRIQSNINADAIVARYGGDEFVVALAGSWNRKQITAFSEVLCEELSKPYDVDGHRIDSSVSIGIAVAPADGTDAKTLIRLADIALYDVKRTGRASSRFFDLAMLAEMHKLRDLEQAVRRCAADEQFQLHFQPLFSADADPRLAGFEALLRLPDKHGEEISAAHFVPMLEELGLIRAVGEWVIRRSAEFAASLPSDLAIAINISPKQFGDGRLAEIVASALSDNAIPGSRLEIEVTEGLLMSNLDGMREELIELKALGVSLAMDDFGVGYSSLSNLWRFPFDRIKLDRSFMVAFDSDRAKVEAMLTSIITLGRSMSLQITAEGIETAEQAAFIKELGLDLVQGFYFGRPTPMEGLPSMFLAWSKRELRTPETNNMRFRSVA